MKTRDILTPNEWEAFMLPGQSSRNALGAMRAPQLAAEVAKLGSHIGGA